ncbi:MAG: phage Gp37/Gp68 family protein [Delftia sp.]|nr:phage Gp37/Gp68 family protein [Delftia sp.]
MGQGRTPEGSEAVSDQTAIEWTDATWNPIRGCSRASEGCRNCYAARMATRLSGPGRPYEGLAAGGQWTGKVRVVESELDRPLRWRKPRHVFVCSMSDLFHEKVPDQAVMRVWNVMAESTAHTFQVLTKRPRRMRLHSLRRWGLGPQVLPSVWLGASAENQETLDERVPHLLRTPAAVRWLSCEPLLGPLDLRPWLDRLGWIVVGGESGPGARPMRPEWVRDIRDQCIAAGVPFFFKQWGGVRKKEAGRLLDGRTWDERPADEAKR